MQTAFDSDEKFIADFNASKRAVLRVAQWLWDRGNIVTLQRSVLRPSFEQRHAYADAGDIDIVCDNGHEIRFDVKYRRRCFQSPNDLPADVHLMPQWKHRKLVDSLRTKPAAGLNVAVASQPLTFVAVAELPTRIEEFGTTKMTNSENKTTVYLTLPRERFSVYFMLEPETGAVVEAVE